MKIIPILDIILLSTVGLSTIFIQDFKAALYLGGLAGIILSVLIIAFEKNIENHEGAPIYVYLTAFLLFLFINWKIALLTLLGVAGTLVSIMILKNLSRYQS